MSELTKCASCSTTLRMPNDNCVLHSSQQGLAIEALEKRVKELEDNEEKAVKDRLHKYGISKWNKALDTVKPLIDGLTVIGWDQKEMDKFWEDFNKLKEK